MLIDRCQFLSNEQTLNVVDRKSIGFNTNENDVKIRDNRAVRYKHFGIVGGTGNIITGNHFFQGDDIGTGERTAGIILRLLIVRPHFSGTTLIMPIFNGPTNMMRHLILPLGSHLVG